MNVSPKFKRFAFFVVFLLVLVVLVVYTNPNNKQTLTENQQVIVTQLEQRKLTSENLYEVQFFCDSILIHTPKKEILFLSVVKYHKARTFMENNQSQAAVTLLEETLPHFKTLKNPKYLVQGMITLSIAYSQINKDSEAQLFALDALEIAKINNFYDQYSRANSSLSYLAYKNNDFDQAMAYLEANQALNVKNRDSSAIADDLNNIGILYKEQGNYKKAHAALQEAQQIFSAQKNYDGLTSIHINTGRIYQKQGLLDSMEHQYLEAARLNEVYKIGNSRALVNVADMYYNNKQYSLAKSYYNKTLKLEKKESRLVTIYHDLLGIAILEDDKWTALNAQKWYDYYSKKSIEKKQIEKQEALEMQAKLYNEKIRLESKQQYTNVVQAMLIILITLFVFIFLYFFQKFKTNQVFNEKNRAQLELKVLRSQMNPHFIFNALSAIQNTVMDKDPLQSAQYISRFAQLIRQNFEFTSKEKVPLQDDINALENYLKTQQMRFENKFTYQIHLDPSIDAQKLEIPPMLLQPFVENAIEHGLKTQKKAGKIDIYISREKKKIQFRIEDNGSGYYPQIDTKLHATHIIKKRLELLEMGDEKSFFIQQHPTHQGTQVQFSLNLLS